MKLDLESLEHKIIPIGMLIMLLMFVLTVGELAYRHALKKSTTSSGSRDLPVRPGQVWLYDYPNTDATGDKNLPMPICFVLDTAEGYTQYQREDGSIGSERTDHFWRNRICVGSPKSTPKTPVAK